MEGQNRCGIRSNAVWDRSAVLFFVQLLRAQSLPATSDTPTFRVTTRLVFLDVTVLDRKGRPVVRGLTKDDFTITEKKKQQPIFCFEAPELHDGAGRPTGCAGRASGSGKPVARNGPKLYAEQGRPALWVRSYTGRAAFESELILFRRAVQSVHRRIAADRAVEQGCTGPKEYSVGGQWRTEPSYGVSDRLDR